MITTEDHICWLIVAPNGEDYDAGEGVAHYRDEQAARDNIHDDTRATVRPLPQPCVSVGCDDCGQDFEGDVFTFHFESRAQAEDLAGKNDWTVTDDGEHYCEGCPVPSDGDEDEPAEATR